MKKLYSLFAVTLFFVSGKAQIINFPDANFKAKLLQADEFTGFASNAAGLTFKIDANNDNEIDVSEAINVYGLFIPNGPFGSNLISDLTGIEMFTNLKTLSCSYNNITVLNLTALTNLESINCYSNQISAINVSGLSHLKNLSAASNQITALNAINYVGANNIESLDLSGNLLGGSIDITNFHNLRQCNLGHNDITSVNLNGIMHLEELNVAYTLLTTVDLSGLTNFKYLDASNSALKSLDVSQNPLLDHLYLQNNHLTTLDLSNNHHFFYLNIRDNNLTSMFIKNGGNDTIELNNNPNLAYICADESELSNIMLYYNTLTEVNSYCSFVPGNTYYTLMGTSRFDFNNNGCDANDTLFPHANFSITNGTISGNLIANASGNYLLPVVAGTHTITPIFEVPGYFNVSPANETVSFPAVSSPYIQDFCITPNGVHHDVEILIVPLSLARPGFAVAYKILFKNKGNQLESGSIDFDFNDSVMDFIIANLAPSSQTFNHLSWNFSDLLPFEARAIIVNFNLNSPTQVPPVAISEILNFTASINISSTDETPTDNTFVLNQTVVNSLDPNDKTCLEGTSITPEMVGKEVHYMIRFENTGTANAENIVVKDMIDTDKFDVNSLIPMDGSAPFVTKITGNKVEFIFENINLPFDDANNDGYVAFKIKTKPSLVLGNTFSNTASIYFDYNAPILTNTTTTTVALLANSVFVFEKYFKIYPNPAHDILNIETKKTIQLTSINIYNTLGQLVLVIPNAQQTKSVDVSSLKTGNYFMKVNSDKGSANMRFVKK